MIELMSSNVVGQSVLIFPLASTPFHTAKPVATTKMSTSGTSPPTLRFAVGSTVVPGDRLVGTIAPQTTPFVAGRGAYTRNGRIHASVVGTLSLEPSSQAQRLVPGRSAVADGKASTDDEQGEVVVGSRFLVDETHRYVVSVRSAKEIASERVLNVEDVVLGRVLRITSQQAVIEILAKHRANGSLLAFPCEGCIRREDVWSASTDDVPLQDSFLPGDVVLARVLSLGDPRRYLLTTAAPELGVVHAVSSASGRPMVPSTWKEMKCTETGAVEPRKVAKPRDLTGA